MELTRKKEITLKTIFLKFLIQMILSWFAVLSIWILLLNLCISCHFIIPANAIETTVNDWVTDIDLTEKFLPNMLPAGTDYACFSKDGELLWTNLSDESLETARWLASSQNEQSKAAVSRRIFLKLSGNGQILILTYQVRATFSSAALRRIFPSAEPFLLLTLLLLFFADLIFFILHYAKKLEKELLLLQDASEQIRLQNLDFTGSRTRILEFNRVLDSLLLLRDELKSSLESQWQMQQQQKKQISALAHDIKTPLTILRGNAELLQESNLNEEQRIYNTFILENTAQIQMYVTRMLAISRAQAAASAASPATLENLLAQIEKAANQLCAKKGLTFLLRTDTIPEAFTFPEEPLKRALMNLIDNAVQYSPIDGIVTLQVCCETSYTDASPLLSFSVSDSGDGFSKKALLHATDDFYRADESRGSKEHFGMGLAITKQIATDLGGTLHLTNQKNGGAIATITVPCASHTEKGTKP